MYSTLIAVALFAAPALADLAISKPTFTQCKEASFSWQKGDGNYNVIVVPASDVCAEPLHDFGDTTKTTMTWDKVALPAGTEVILSLIDSAGVEGISGVIKVQSSDDDSCVPKNLLDAAKAAAKPSVVPSPPAASPPVASPPAASPPATPPTPPTTNPDPPANPPTDPEPSGPAPVAIGAANAGTNPFASDNGAISAGAAAPVVFLSAIFGALAAFF